jgi:arginyl-tRNA--protein-N-Asp/Glu arginylyltransferase
MAMEKYPACAYPSFPPPVDIPLVVLPSHECSYLSGRVATSRAFYAAELSPELYHELMDCGFRRSGKVIYQPICGGCRACLPIRIEVDRFAPNKSQRRCVRRNVDLTVVESVPLATDEKFDLYCRYVRDWHGADLQNSPTDRESFESFLYDSPVKSIEFNYRDGTGKLLAVGICDWSDRSLSSVYFYFDPTEAARGLGTLGVLHELAWAAGAGKEFYYLGFWVHGCPAMEYKAKFQPHQILSPEGEWCGGVEKM